MNQIVTKAIVLARTNYQEADRILTLLTPDHGKVRVLAKGVRKSKSKLAGGIELLSISEIGFIRGRGELCTLTSARLQTHFGNITTDMDRTMFAYEVLKRINKITEDNAGPEYFGMLADALHALNDLAVDFALLQLWFDVRLLHVSGHEPNLTTTVSGAKLEAGKPYNFDLEDMAFSHHPEGMYSDSHIKLLRLVNSHTPTQLSAVQGITNYVQLCCQLATSIRKQTLMV